jgi:hypothetical protein
VLSEIFGCKRQEGKGGWRKLHNEELYKLYSSSNVVKDDQTKGNGVKKPEGRRLLVRSMGRLENIVKLDLTEMGCEGRIQC